MDSGNLQSQNDTEGMIVWSLSLNKNVIDLSGLFHPVYYSSNQVLYEDSLQQV